MKLQRAYSPVVSYKRLLTLFCNNILQNIQNICALYLWTQWNVALPAHVFLVSYFCAMTLKLNYVKGYVKSRSSHLKQVVFCLKVAQSVWFLSSEAEWALQKDSAAEPFSTVCHCFVFKVKTQANSRLNAGLSILL